MSAPESDVRIRPPTEDDVDQIADFNARLAQETEDLELDRDVLREGVKAVIRDPHRGFYLLAESGGETIGQILVTKEWSDWRCAYFWWLQSVYVLPRFRGRGVFGALYRHVRRMARAERDAHSLRLYVHVENEDAQEVYTRLGMRELPYKIFGSSGDDL